MHIQIGLGTKFPLKLTIFILKTRFAQKGVFWSKTEKVNTTYSLHNSAYSNKSSAKFQLKLTILIFLDQICQNRKSEQQQVKTERTSPWNSCILELCILELVLVQNFSSN